MGINSVNNYTGIYTNSGAYKTTGESSTSVAKEESKTNTAADVLSSLQKKFGSGVSIMSGSYQAGTMFGSCNTTNIMIHPAYLQKIANDPEATAECEDAIAYFEKFDQQRRASQAAAGWTVKASGWACDKDGNWSGWCVVEKTGGKSYTQKLAEDMEKITQQRMEKKAEQKDAEETRQAKKDEQAELEEKLEKACKKQMGSRFKGFNVMDEDEDEMEGPYFDVRA